MVFGFDDVILAYRALLASSFIIPTRASTRRLARTCYLLGLMLRSEELLFMSIPLGDKTSTKFDTGDTAIPKLEYYLSIETDFLTRKEIFEPLTAVQKEIYFWTHRF